MNVKATKEIAHRIIEVPIREGKSFDAILNLLEDVTLVVLNTVVTSEHSNMRGVSMDSILDQMRRNIRDRLDSLPPVDVKRLILPDEFKKQ